MSNTFALLFFQNHIEKKKTPEPRKPETYFSSECFVLESSNLESVRGKKN